MKRTMQATRTEPKPQTKLRRSDSVGRTNASARRAPIQARAEETRLRILKTARTAFAEHGFAGANIRDIAKAAGVTHSMVTYHFGTKDELWREAVTDMFALAEREVFSVLANTSFSSPIEKHKLFIRLYTRYSAANPDHARIIISESIRGGERLKWMVEHFIIPTQIDAIKSLNACMETGEIPKMPIPSFLYALTGMIRIPFILAEEAKLVTGYDFLSDDAIEAYAEAVIGLFFQRQVQSETP